MKKRIAWNKGKRLSPEHIEKLRQAKLKASGSNSNRWKGGSWLYWRKQALIRDDYTCQICGLRDPEIMTVDHIKPKSLFPELKLEINNLVCLCPNCHAKKTNREMKMTKTKI